MQALAKALGDPQDSFRSVLIAGTNGKGSVARMLSAMMPKAGLYTSPHLRKLNERIRIGSDEISDSDLKAIFEHVKRVADSTTDLLYPPTYFEIVTAISFCYFREQRVSFAVLEVGLGGRLDATNIVRQDVSVITAIGLDHQEFLGDTLQQIAGEKAGIIKGHEPVVIGPQADLDVIRNRAGVNLVVAGAPGRVESLGGGYFEIDIDVHKGLRPGLPGRHQIDNALVAVRTAECLDLDANDIRRGIDTATWPGRLERVEGAPPFILDGAHNLPAMEALARFLGEFYPDGVWMIFGAMADKQIEQMLKAIGPHVQQAIFTRVQSSRAKEPGELQSLIKNSVVKTTVSEAISYARTYAPAGSTIVVCGSLYLIGEARAVLQ
jgi:dihydrofolate synthase/folylpolyglutamate synthase